MGGQGRSRLRSFLTVTEVALAVILLAGAGLLIQTFVRLSRVNLGFRPDTVLTLDFVFPRAQDLPLRPRAVMLRQILDRVEALPEVRSAGTAADLPLGGGSDSMDITLPGRPATFLCWNENSDTVRPRAMTLL
jgi:putative ABC transport system permease protein